MNRIALLHKIFSNAIFTIHRKNQHNPYSQLRNLLFDSSMSKQILELKMCALASTVEIQL